MLQFNLLPDVKVEYVRAQRAKRLVTGVAIFASVGAITITLLLALVVYGVQKKNLSDLNGDIKKYGNQLKATPDLNKILTIQNQLGVLNGLHDQKLVTSRLFQIVQQTTPTGVTISSHSTDYEASTMTISGSASSFDRVNVFTDTLKFATYSDGEEGSEPIKPFNDVVLAQFGKSADSTSYTLTFSFEPVLFDSASAFNLSIPKQITTGSVTSQPTEIFKATESTQGTGSNR